MPEDTKFIEIDKTMMDNEVGFINATLNDFNGKFKINHAFVVAGEHVSVNTYRT